MGLHARGVSQLQGSMMERETCFALRIGDVVLREMGCGREKGHAVSKIIRTPWHGSQLEVSELFCYPREGIVSSRNFSGWSNVSVL